MKSEPILCNEYFKILLQNVRTNGESRDEWPVSLYIRRNEAMATTYSAIFKVRAPSFIIIRQIKLDMIE